jgi:transcriptional regulator with XRE-family HTH domain
MSVKRPDPVDVEVGHRIRIERLSRGLSQTALASQLGVTFQQVQKYEKGVNRIGASRLFDLAHVLGVPVQFFYDDLPAAGSDAHAAVGFADRPADSYVVDFLSSREGLELNKAFVKISDARARRAIVDLVRALAGNEAAS